MEGSLSPAGAPEQGAVCLALQVGEGSARFADDEVEVPVAVDVCDGRRGIGGPLDDIEGILSRARAQEQGAICLALQVKEGAAVCADHEVEVPVAVEVRGGRHGIGAQVNVGGRDPLPG